MNRLTQLGAVTTGTAAASLVVARLSDRIDLEAASVTVFGFYGDLDRVWTTDHTRALLVGIAIIAVWAATGRLVNAGPHATRSPGPAAERLPRPAWAALAAAATTTIWNAALVRTSGRAELTRIVESKFEYRRVALQIEDPAEFLRTFVDSLTRYTVHVKGHPPLFPLILWSLDRAGLGDPRVEALLLIVSWSVAVAGVVMIVARLGNPLDAWLAAPVVATMPAVVWAGISADAFIAAVVVWTTLAVVVAIGDDQTNGADPSARTNGADPSARTSAARAGATAAAGIGVATSLLLTYGAPILLLPAAIVALRRPRTAMFIALIGAGIVAEVGRRGFWWFDGLTAVRHFYDTGIAADRPRWFFSLSNLSVAAWAMGPATLVGIAAAVRRGIGITRVAAGSVVVAILAANVSGMSKAEVERIWLPLFAVSGLAVAVGTKGSQRAYGTAAVTLNVAIGLGWEWMLRGNW